MRSGLQRIKGFTLIELLAVIAIIGILATLAAIGISTASKRARDASRQTDLRGVKDALELYAQDNGEYPIGTTYDDLEEPLVQGNYIRAFPKDPRTSSSNSEYRYQYNSDGDDFVLYATLEYKSTRKTLDQPANCNQADDITIKGNGVVNGGDTACFRVTND